MVDRRRHAPSRRTRNPTITRDARGLPQLYRGRARRTYRDVYDRDHSGGGFRWLISTCIAAAVGAIAIAVVIIGSLERQPRFDNVFERISDAQRPAPQPARRRDMADGLNWAMPKSDRLEVASGALSARYTIHEQANVRRNNRPFIEIRPYLRIVARLAPASQSNADVIPALNPFQLYAVKAAAPDGATNSEDATSLGRVDVKVVELLGHILPGQEDLQLDIQDVTEIISRTQSLPNLRRDASLETTGRLPADLTPNYLSSDGFGISSLDQIDPNVSVLRRTVIEDAEAEISADAGEVRVVRIGKGETLIRILQRMGAPDWLAGNMIEAANKVTAMNQVSPGQQVHVRLVPSPTKPDQMEPAGFTLFGTGHTHLVSVTRDDSGEFTASPDIDRRALMRSFANSSGSDRLATLYSAIYDSALTQNLSPQLIRKIMRIHAYETDYRKRVRNGDQVEWFFELRKQSDGTAKTGELLFTSIRSGGQTNRFWRFRTHDGVVDYYDDRGHNSKKFLMRKPVRGSDVRLTSGFGLRLHPIYRQRRMHTGVDWAGPLGTPILAAGKGIVEEARRRGTYGNYVRIKHANGYHTTYAHMHRFGPGIRKGVKVRQGQVIGYLGSTGLSSGPHLHYEVLVNQRFVDPLKIKMPRERLLKGQELAAYQRERNRIDRLLKRSPVETRSR